MDREKLEEMLSRRIDGALSPREDVELNTLLASDPDARALADSWQETAAELQSYADSLGYPAPMTRAELRAINQKRPVLRLSAIAASVVLAFLIGLLAADQLGLTKSAILPVAVENSDNKPGDALLQQALMEAWKLLPNQVSYASIHDGRFKVVAMPVARELRAENCYFVSFLLEGASNKSNVCQIALMSGEVAELQGDGWQLRAEVITTISITQLRTEFTYQSTGTMPMRIVSSPNLTDGLVEVGSFCSDAEKLTLRAMVTKIDTRSLVSATN